MKGEFKNLASFLEMGSNSLEIREFERDAYEYVEFKSFFRFFDFSDFEVILSRIPANYEFITFGHTDKGVLYLVIRKKENE